MSPRWFEVFAPTEWPVNESCSSNKDGDSRANSNDSQSNAKGPPSIVNDSPSNGGLYSEEADISVGEETGRFHVSGVETGRLDVSGVSHA